MDTLFRIHTEWRDNLPGIVGARFDGFTVTRAMGFWRGTRESAAVIEVYAWKEEAGDVHEVARQIRAANMQEAVLVVEIPLQHSSLVTAVS